METSASEDAETKSESNQDVEQDYKFTGKAHDEFKKGNYEKCLEALDELERCSGSNSQLRHNRAVAKFYQTECKDHEALLKALTAEVCDESSLSATDSTTSSPPEPYSNAITSYNIAIIYYHRHMYRTALETLAPLVDNLDMLAENIAPLVSTLNLRLLLATNQLQKAYAFLLELLQRQFQKPNRLTVEGLLLDDNSSTQDVVATSSSLDGYNFKLLVLLTHILNRKTVAVLEDGSAEFAALKAHQYYIMKDFQMAAKQLKKINAIGPTSGIDKDVLNTYIANNMGVIHLRVRHYAIAAKFFQDAICFDKQIAANIRNVSLYRMSAARSCEILYNLGISMLHLRRPKEAFQCFLVPLKSYHSNPRLWFRMAEACIMDHEIKVLEEEKKPVTVASVISEGRQKKFNSQPSPSLMFSNVMYTGSSQSAAVPEPTLEFAALALRNALTLTNYYKSAFEMPTESESDVQEMQNWKSIKDNNFCNPSQPISKQSLDNLLSAIYAAYSYVSLRLGDYVIALEMAQELLKAEKLSDAHRLLGHMYAGEALIMLNKLEEARPHLEPTFVSSLNAFDFETKDWRVKSLDAAQNVVRYNLAVAMALQHDYNVSKSLLSSCTHPIVAAKTLQLKAYLDIKMGKCT